MAKPVTKRKILATITISVEWQGEYKAVIGEDFIDIYDQTGERVYSRARRYLQLSMDYHYAFLTLTGKFKLDENDMRIAPVGVDFKLLQPKPGEA